MLLSRLTTAARLRAPLVRFSSSSAVSTTVRPLSQVSWLTDSAKIQIAQAEAKQAADASRQKTTDTSFKTPFAPVLFESTDSNRIPNTRGKYREQVCRTPIIPISTKKLNLVAQLLSGMEVERAMLQLMFMPLGHTKEILWAIKEGCSIAEKIQKVDPRQFYISYAYVCPGPSQKGIDIKGRGRFGKKLNRSSYMVLMLRDKKFLADQEAKKAKRRAKKHDRYAFMNRRIINPKVKL